MARDEGRPAVSGRDAAGIGPHLREGMRLVPLKELDGFRLADGEPDIRGWEVQTVSGRKVGEVDDVLVDEHSGEVVLLDVDLDGTRRRTLAPARAVQLQRDRRVVLIDSTELRDAEQLPTLARTGDVTADELRLFRDNFSQIYGARAWRDDRDYEIHRRDQNVRIGREGAADMRLADTRESPLPDRDLRDRELRDRDMAAGAATRDVRFPRDADEVVVERRPVVMEEVVVRRRVVDPNEVSATDALDAERIEHRAETEQRETDAQRRARELREDERRL